ncbi:MAG: Modification methylase DpnIIB [Alphaproteobacteria bacterium MarineAlpha5_Bin8]|nr:MAG: Modification methylase DpnIIB [Alphaproteobacteria bacterium MarineAlpha5_Bin7]PPR48136.1 MAG: Modification methylase DpnIIB [Alphaproteobacteria bacterium MarineAlpha5_Bin8]PPR53427.1 MAG: Modification methylase DpnIIB [Alphaproteobacteria bacterium MarineAlpha5_Bin6]|tara:strand:+ start:2362 stop:3438 length:1077 start_codon:yes stop_codon:yes gene_type:complete
MLIKKNSIIQGNSLEILKHIPEKSVDLIFADPPYNLQLKDTLYRPDQSTVEAVNNDWDKFDNYQAYDKFCLAWLKECKRILKDGGAFWVIGSYHNILRLGTSIQNLGFWILNDIIWHKTNPMPNFRGTRFTNAHETLLWCTSSRKAKYTFNYQNLKELNEGKQMRSDWHIPICSGKERLRKSNNQRSHPTQKPQALLYRILVSSTNKGDTILDPFLGSGTTAVMAKKLQRNFIGIEKDKEYIVLAKKRLKDTKPLNDEIIKLKKSRKDLPKIPFGELVEQGVIPPGAVLTDKKERYKATVTIDGSIKINDMSGSIHQVGAKIQGLPSCNGWDFWHVKEKNSSTLLDEIRGDYRSKKLN